MLLRVLCCRFLCRHVRPGTQCLRSVLGVSVLLALVCGFSLRADLIWTDDATGIGAEISDDTNGIDVFLGCAALCGSSYPFGISAQRDFTITSPGWYLLDETGEAQEGSPIEAHGVTYIPSLTVDGDTVTYSGTSTGNLSQLTIPIMGSTLEYFDAGSNRLSVYSEGIAYGALGDFGFTVTEAWTLTPVPEPRWIGLALLGLLIAVRASAYLRLRAARR